MNTTLASATEATAVFLAEHDHLPDVAVTELIPNHTDGTTTARLQLRASMTELANLVTFADELTDASASITRHDSPNAFTEVNIYGTGNEIPVQVWTHPEEHELAALWRATGHMPEFGIYARVDVETLRAAALDAAETHGTAV